MILFQYLSLFYTTKSWRINSFIIFFFFRSVFHFLLVFFLGKYWIELFIKNYIAHRWDEYHENIFIVSLEFLIRIFISRVGKIIWFLALMFPFRMFSLQYPWYIFVVMILHFFFHKQKRIHGNFVCKYLMEKFSFYFSKRHAIRKLWNIIGKIPVKVNRKIMMI